MPLPKRILGRTGLAVTALGYGAMEIRGPRIWGGRPVTDSQAETILNAVLDSGINFLDTANDYGRSEALIGQVISHRRGEYLLATKCGCRVVPKEGDRDETSHVWTRENLFRGLHESLDRLRTDYVDLLQLHNPSAEEALQHDLAAVLEEMRQQGKVRWIGCSSTFPHLDAFIEWGVFDTFQIPYSALERRHENALTRAGASGAGVIDRGGVARGEPGAGLGSAERWDRFEAAGLDEVRAEGESRTAFLLRFLLSHPDIDTTIVGTLSPVHLSENVAAAEKGPLPADLYAEAKRRLDAAGETAEP